MTATVYIGQEFYLDDLDENLSDDEIIDLAYQKFYEYEKHGFLCFDKATILEKGE